MAFRLENRRIRDEKQRNVRKIAPLIYFELNDNLNAIKGIFEMKTYIPFKTNFWNIYKDEISLWDPKNVVLLTSIYDHINYFEGSSVYIKPELISSYEKELKNCGNMIIYILKWYDEAESLKEGIKNAKKRYDEMLSIYGKSELEEYHPKFTNTL